MSFSQAFGAPYILARKGSDTAVIPLLTMEQLATISATVEKRRKELLARNAKEQKLDRIETAEFIQRGEQTGIEIADIQRHAKTIEGANAVLALVLSADDLAKLSPYERQEAALGAIGWIENIKPEGKQSPNPSPDGGESSGNATAG